MTSPVTDLAVPSTLSPSKITAFTSCPLAFRFSVVEHLPEPPSAAALKGTLVHRALELLFTEYPPGSRSRDAAQKALDGAWQELQGVEELDGLGLDDAERIAFLVDSRVLVDRYLELEDPDTVRAIGLELNLSTELNGVTVRGRRQPGGRRLQDRARATRRAVQVTAQRGPSVRPHVRS